MADTVRPRLERLGADCSNIFALNEPLALDQDGRERLEHHIERYRPSLVSIDPLFAYAGSAVDIHRANQTREIMAGLASIAERHGCAIICIRHLTKSANTSALYRGLGSIDIAAAARSVLLVGRDPENPNLRGVAQIKNNLGPFGRTFGFELTAGEFHWVGEIPLAAEDLLRQPASSPDASCLENAKAFLEERLAFGERPVQALEEEAKEAGITSITLRRAKESLGVKSFKRGFGGGQWYWKLPEGDQVDHLRETDNILENKLNDHLQGKSSSKVLKNKHLFVDDHD